MVTMGEANRRKDAMAKAPCMCGSLKPAKECCFNGQSWHKTPAVLGLKNLPFNSMVGKCYMNELGSCDGGISGEHLISESIILLLKSDGEFTVSGLPWISRGEVKILSPKNLTANCLCREHNSAISPLDDAALYLFSALKACLDCEVESLHYLVSGHDIERWLLKTVKALAASKNLARDQQRLPGTFASDVEVLNMLDDPKCWLEGTGLYCIMNAGDLMKNHNRFQLAPYINLQDELSGLRLNIMGLDFILMLEPPDLNLSPLLKGATFRPGQIMINFPSSTNCIAISWEDGKQHNDVLTIEFLHSIEI